MIDMHDEILKSMRASPVSLGPLVAHVASEDVDHLAQIARLAGPGRRR